MRARRLNLGPFSFSRAPVALQDRLREAVVVAGEQQEA
jgi:hypothetical protein